MTTQNSSSAFELPPAMQRMTGLARMVDPTVPGNRNAIIGGVLALVGYIVVALLGETSSEDAFIDGGLFALGVFLAWALAREIDPDRQHSGTLAMVGAALSMAVMGIPSLLALAGVMLGARILLGSTGLSLTYGDALSLAGVAGLAAFFTQAWLVGVGLFAAVLVTAFLSDGKPLPLYVGAGAVGIATVGGVLLVDEFSYGWGQELVPLVLAVAMMLAYAVVMMLSSAAVVSLTDFNNKPMSAQRLIAARAFVFCMALAFLVYEGANGVADLSAVYGTMAAVAVVVGRVYVQEQAAAA